MIKDQVISQDQVPGGFDINLYLRRCYKYLVIIDKMKPSRLQGDPLLPAINSHNKPGLFFLLHVKDTASDGIPVVKP